MRPYALLTPGAMGGGDPDVVLWSAAVVSAGGTVSAARKALVTTLVQGLKAAGTWSKLDDAWLLASENATQALVSLKQLRTASVVAAPTFTTDRGYAFNGSTNYIDTGFIPSAMALSMTGTNLRIAVYERTNVLSNVRAAGTSDSGTVNLEMRPRALASTVFSATNSGSLSYTLAVDDSRGYTAVSRNGADATTCASYKNGVALAQSGSVSFGSTLPTRSIYVGCYNNAGTAAAFRADTVAFVDVGAQLTAQQEADHYTAIQAYMTAIGANV